MRVPKPPQAIPWVVMTRVKGSVKIYGPYRKSTALKYKKAWQDAMGNYYEARVVRLDKFERFREGMKRR